MLTYEKLGMIPGRYTTKGCDSQNRKRLYNAEYKNKDTSKLRRKIIRGKQKGASDKNIEKECTLYESGAF